MKDSELDGRSHVGVAMPRAAGRAGLAGVATLGVALVIGACAPVAPPRLAEAAAEPGADPDPEKEGAAGLKLVTGVVTMSGGSKVTCSFQQQGDVRLEIALVPECDTKAPLWLLIRAGGNEHEASIPRVLKDGVEDTFTSFQFPTPGPGTLVRTRVRADCSGVGAGRIWATSHCRVPERPR
jgi:hypothetical protein